MKNEKINILGIVSILIPTIVSILILNFLLGIVPIEKIEGLPLVMPMFLCPIGAIIGFIAYRYRKDQLSMIGIIFNIILFLFPIAYNIFVTLIFGV
ncbi:MULTISPECIES: hypothetical protein [Salinicoccus]|uniref:hypothetical protein n=1 Tax=Salinicoccus TaxID=45669 RepID=UPI0004E279D3|nr:MULTISPECIES: hypothetical protein [Salinicoccus]RPE54516.1 hypothetical protein EDC33_0772 [Salinicoccus roseus]GGA64910.1 hypothetical protein GCM10007176_06640 [Salinicoccus roseus]